MSKQQRQFAKNVRANVGKDLFGLDEVVNLCIVALCCDGHVLLEGNPGLGKTELVKSLSNTLFLPFKRIQFTPDLMPADITGSMMPDENNIQKLKFQPGPILTNLLLADEINRATPKTQSAMLQAMAEKEVTVLGVDHACGDPFMVLATQNPLDQEGTYQLPEAQSDRFMFNILMPMPTLKTALRIIEKTAGQVIDIPREDLAQNKPQETNNTIELNNEQDTRSFLKETKKSILDTKPQLAVQQHITNLFLATNGVFDEVSGLGARQEEILEQWQEMWSYGLGPRAISALMIGAKAWQGLFIDDEPASGDALLKVALPVLRHRIRLNFEWRQTFANSLGLPYKDDLEPDTLIATLLLLTAPNQPGYQLLLRNAIGGEICSQLKSKKVIN